MTNSILNLPRGRELAMARLADRTDRSGPCWLWTRGTTGAGYGRFAIAGVEVYAHRASYEVHVGPIPQGLFILHSCDTPACVNPAHLRAGTARENVLDRTNHGHDANARKTHCPQGHAYDAQNTAARDGSRACKRCRAAATRRWRRRVTTASPTERPTTLAAAFRAAARLIALNGHHQGDYCPDPFDRRTSSPHSTRPLSIVAAIRCVASPHGDNPHRISELSEAAVKVLADRLEVDGEPAWNDEPHHLEGHVANWGDVEGRTVESVVAVLEAAADANEVSA